MRQRSFTLKVAAQEKEDQFGPFRRKLRQERSVIPPPGTYHKEQEIKVEECKDPIFKSKTPKLVGFLEPKNDNPPPGYYPQDEHTISRKIHHPMVKSNTTKDLCFESHQPRFDYSKKPVLQKVLNEAKRTVTDEEKMLNLVRNLYKGADMGVKYTNKEGVYYTDPY